MSLAADHAFWIGLPLRMLISAGIVVAASVAVERTGPFMGAMIATLPLSAGPAYAFLALDHDAAFLAAGAVGSLLSVAATTMFLVAHVATASRGAGTAASIAAALFAWAGSLALFSQWRWSLGGALALTFGLQALGVAYVRGPRATVAPAAIPASRWLLVSRALAVMGLVATVLLVGRALGPGAAGMAALVPIVFTSLILILQPRAGGPATAAVMANGVVGMVGYGFAFAALNLTAESLGSGAALGLALAACVGWNTLMLLARRARLI